jgi:hypothetical protein
MNSVAADLLPGDRRSLTTWYHDPGDPRLLAPPRRRRRRHHPPLSVPHHPVLHHPMPHLPWGTILSYGPPWAHYLDGYQDRLLGGPLRLPNLRCTVPDGVKHKNYRGEVLG